MNQQFFLKTLQDVKAGITSPEEALLKMKMQPFEDIGFAKIDMHRSVRQGIAEVVYGAGKTPEQILQIIRTILAHEDRPIIVTRMQSSAAELIAKEYDIKYESSVGVGIIGEFPEPDGHGKIVVATGGTSDMPVAEEAALTAEALGNEVVRLYDVGVAGLHRLLAHLDVIMNARVIIAIAGMEGALASVIGGLADCPVIGVPTSVGYGTSFHGLSALLAMLNSCASGVSVVNIDNGFGAGYLASMINHMRG
ncbi:MAG: pyridinium-3,5-biscarboxylic acid mononucleotide synthase [Clostridiales bacterium]|jgi:NCAIR mutase (PurE)-related protein|nr:pyridinium-3,5-biscarboxylic acid mononucleotide synthase [Clostridiales bacterium]